MRKFIIAFMVLIYIFTIPVFASEEDILSEPIIEHENINDGNSSLIDDENTNSENDLEIIDDIITLSSQQIEEINIDSDYVSNNEILKEILNTNRSILKNVEIINEFVSGNCVSTSYVSDNTISDNLINKKLVDYNTSESLALIGLVLAFGALLVYVIHKSVFKIRR